MWEADLVTRVDLPRHLLGEKASHLLNESFRARCVPRPKEWGNNWGGASNSSPILSKPHGFKKLRMNL